MSFRTHHDPAEVYAAGEIMLEESRPPWMADAACLEHPELDWVPGRAEDLQPHKRVCRCCLDQPECLAYALADRWLMGVWGGNSAKQRNLLRRDTG